MTRITLSLSDEDDRALDELCERDARDPRRFATLLLSRALRDELNKSKTPAHQLSTANVLASDDQPQIHEVDQ
jgi:predicted transcriptional regulator